MRRGGRITAAQLRAITELWPEYGLEIGDAPVDPAALFGNHAPLVLEVGFGMGESLHQMCLDCSDHNFIGVEAHRPGIGRLMARAAAANIRNLRICEGDACDLLERALPQSCLARVQIYFPDPWPKKRHHKRRLIQRPFADLLASRLAGGGLLHIATDWQPYALHIQELLAGHPEYEPRGQRGLCPRPPWRPMTRFERRGQRLGHAIADLLYTRA